jgi:hypothetical protein
MKIRYITSHGIGVRSEFEYAERDTLILAVEVRHVGAIVLDGKIFALNDGEVRIPLSTISDGDHIPRLESEIGIYALEGFTKRGKSISVHDLDEATVRRSITWCCSLEKELSCVKERLAKLEKACSGHNIFDFERKKDE